MLCSEGGWMCRWMCLGIFLLAFAALVSASSAPPQSSEQLLADDPQLHKRGSAGIRLCGRRLIKIVARLCRNCVAAPPGMQMSKRSPSQDEFLSEIMAPSAVEEDSINSINSIHSMEEGQDLHVNDGDGDDGEGDVGDLLSLFHDTPNRQRRAGGGIANRCCKHKCTYSYLKRFCCKTARTIHN